MSDRIRWILVGLSVTVVLFLWIPPMKSEVDSPPPPLVAKPAMVILIFAALGAAAAAPLRSHWQCLIALLMFGSTIGAWLAARILWGGYLPD